VGTALGSNEAIAEAEKLRQQITDNVRAGRSADWWSRRAQRSATLLHELVRHLRSYMARNRAAQAIIRREQEYLPQMYRLADSLNADCEDSYYAGKIMDLAEQWQADARDAE
jgi:hypothetical protein